MFKTYKADRRNDRGWKGASVHCVLQHHNFSVPVPTNCFQVFTNNAFVTVTT